MNTKEFGNYILNLKHLHDIPIEIERYFDDIEYLFLKKDFDITRPSEEKKEEILKIFFKYFPDINQKNIKFIRSYKNYNYISYFRSEKQSNTVIFTKEIILSEVTSP